MFAVERIKSLTLTDHPYQMPLHFDMEAYVENALVVIETATLPIFPRQKCRGPIEA